ncbi:hypothetical protein O1M54_43330 [Streptomyces diastatochromogenes]|nr:hypothetical protein [Streptomyces diastatochromogenes]
MFGLLEGLLGGARGNGLRMLRTLLGDELTRAVEAGVGAEGLGVRPGPGRQRARARRRGRR